jgi:hypothetical protein
MSIDLKAMLRWDSERREGKPLLIIPNIDDLNKEYRQEVVSKQLAECAKVIKAKGLLYRWRKFVGPAVLVTWDKESRQFTNFDNNLFRHWLGAHFDLVDSRGVSFGLPAAGTAGRIWEELLRDESGLDWASWDLTTEWRKNGK